MSRPFLFPDKINSASVRVSVRPRGSLVGLDSTRAFSFHEKERNMFLEKDLGVLAPVQQDLEDLENLKRFFFTLDQLAKGEHRP